MLLKKTVGALIGAAGIGAVSLIFSFALAALLAMGIGPVAILIIPITFIWAMVWGGLVGWRRADPRSEYTLLDCSQCGYSLRGSSGDACPECGQPLDDDRKRYRNTWLYGIHSEPEPTRKAGE